MEVAATAAVAAVSLVARELQMAQLKQQARLPVQLQHPPASLLELALLLLLPPLHLHLQHSSRQPSLSWRRRWLAASTSACNCTSTPPPQRKRSVREAREAPLWLQGSRALASQPLAQLAQLRLRKAAR